MPLPQLPGATEPGDVFAVSENGLYAVGTSHDGRSTTGATNQAVRWTSAGAIENLMAGDSSLALGVSNDGSVVVGYRNVVADQTAFRWTSASGTVNIGDLAGGQTSSRARDVSGDGSVVVGLSFATEGGTAFRWTEATGMMGLGDLPGGIFASEAYGSSNDGSVVVGWSDSANGTEAFRWTAQDGMVGLGDLAGGGSFSEAYDVSANGSVVVGTSAANPGFFPYRAFRWTAVDGMIELPDVIGVGPTAVARAASSDGEVIVGGAYQGDSAIGFAWDAFHGSRSIAELLSAQGVEVGEFHLGTARGVSGDGLTIVGSGINASREFQPWMARLDAGTFVPEPSTIGLGAVALLTSLVWWRSVGTAG